MPFEPGSFEISCCLRTGSGSIDVDELGLLLSRLRVPLPDAELVSLYQRIAGDKHGIGFDAFSKYGSLYGCPMCRVYLCVPMQMVVI